MQKRAFDVGRAIGKHPLAGHLFCLIERALPVRRLARTRRVVAFLHPRPSYDPHILLVPTTPFPALATTSLPAAQKIALLWEMAALAGSLAEPSRAEWQMVINGGTRQDVGQVHGHLIQAGNDASRPAYHLDDPTTHLNVWTRFLERVQQAAQVPSNGYSVTFRFKSEGGLTATFSESARP